MLGVILAGGKATRLGPLAAQLNKALVSVGSKPMLIRQVQQLQGQGCDLINVVVSPGAQIQVDDVLERAGATGVKTVIQSEARGPGDAILVGLTEKTGSVVVMTADTVIPDDQFPARGRDIVLVSEAPTEREWCVAPNDECDAWVDRVGRVGEHVAIGVYSFNDARALHDAAWADPSPATGEVSITQALNTYSRSSPLDVWYAGGWADVGDVAALADANRTNFLSRSFHDVQLGSGNVVRKKGPSVTDEADAIRAAPRSARPILPRVLDVGDDWYSMEYVDSPSLAELWCYWPAQPSMWEHVTSELTHQLDARLHGHHKTNLRESLERRAHTMYVDKLAERYADGRGADMLTILPRLGGDELVRNVTRDAQRVLVPTCDPALLHGDPNFTNVMWSLRTGGFKILDPRGSWGGPTLLGDSRYDFAKIGLSPFIVPVMHGLFDLESDHVRLWPQRIDETHAVLNALTKYVSLSDLYLLIAHMLLSSAPLHDGDEGPALFIMGARMYESWRQDPGDFDSMIAVTS